MNCTASILVVLSALLAACNSDPEPAASDGVEESGDEGDAVDLGESAEGGPPTWADRSLEGRWYGGDFHVHSAGASNDVSDQSTPQRIREVAIERGLAFLVLTDHSNSTGSDTTTTDEDPDLFNLGPEFTHWDLAAELSDESFLMIDGNELSPIAEEPSRPTGHIGCYPKDRESFDPDIAFVDRPRGTVDGAQSIEQALDAGCYVTVNHPYGPTWIAYDWTSRDYNALEIWNGAAGFDFYDEFGMQAWTCDLALGRRVVGLGGSDNHHIETAPPGTLLDAALGYPTTWVWAESLSWNRIIAAVELGRVSISDTGSPLDLDVYDAAGGWLAMNGGEFAVTQGRWLRARGTAGETPASRVLRIARVEGGSCEDLRVPHEMNTPRITVDLLYDEEVESGADFEVVIPLALDPGDAVYVIVRPRDGARFEHDVVISNAVFGVD
jgi:hypothetical protein